MSDAEVSGSADAGGDNSLPSQTFAAKARLNSARLNLGLLPHDDSIAAAVARSSLQYQNTVAEMKRGRAATVVLGLVESSASAGQLTSTDAKKRKRRSTHKAGHPRKVHLSEQAFNMGATVPKVRCGVEVHRPQKRGQAATL